MPNAAMNYDGRLEIFYALSNSAAYHSWQQSPAAEQNWLLNAELGGWIVGSPAVASNGDGRLEVFADGGSGAIYHNWQLSPGGAWSGWTFLTDGPVSQPPSVVENADGTLSVFAVINNVVYMDQELNADDSSNWTGWVPVAGASIATTPSAVLDVTGNLYIFAQGTDSSAWYNVLSATTGQWSGWSSLAGYIVGSPSAALNLNGLVQIFVQGGGNVVYTNVQNADGTTWAGWQSVGGSTVSAPTVVANQDGTLEIFAVDINNGPWHNWQTSPGGDWNGWTELGGYLTSAMGAFRNVDGRLEVFGAHGDNLYFNYQLTAEGGWSGWNPIGATTIPGTYGAAATAAGFGFKGGPPSSAENSAFLNFANGTQRGNQAPTQSGTFPTWPCANVAVSFPGFPNKFNKQIVRAVDNWNRQLASWGSPVVLTIGHGDGMHSITIRYMTPVQDSYPCVAPTSLTQGYTHLCSATRSGNYLLHVDIDINNAIKVGDTITNVVAHEIGHTFQLADCPNCSFESVMSTDGTAYANSPFYIACRNGMAASNPTFAVKPLF